MAMVRAETIEPPLTDGLVCRDKTSDNIQGCMGWRVRVIQLSVKETRGTSQLCPRCGKRITQVDRKGRQLYCAECNVWMDRDVVAAMNLSFKGLARFASSQGAAGEAMRGNPGAKMSVILRVDAAKLSRYCQQPKVDRVVHQPKI
jgi:hypothetical protein